MATRHEPLPADRLEVLPATGQRWDDVVALLGGGPERGCWCQAWRGSAVPTGRSEMPDNRAALGLPRWLMRLDL